MPEVPYAEIRGNHTRRDFLRVGVVSPLVASLALHTGKSIEAIEAGMRHRTHGTILLFLDGGANDKDLWYPDDPRAPSNYRGEFKSVEAVDGMRLTEVIPNMAKHADQIAVVANIDTGSSSHSTGAANQILPKGGKVPYAKEWGERMADGGPPYVMLQNITPWAAHIQNEALQPKLKGPQFGGPIEKLCEQNPFTLPLKVLPPKELERMFARRELLHQLDILPSTTSTMQAINKNNDTAFALTTGRGKFVESFHPLANFNSEAATESEQRRRTEDLQSYMEDVERYGDTNEGINLLTARRLAQTGTGWVTYNHGTWDLHGDIHPETRKRIGPLDKAVAALLEDQRRGVYDGLFIILTDFTRTPFINTSAGRDHHNATSMVLAGPGINGGVVSGQRNYQGEIKGQALVAKDGHVLNTITHALAEHPNDFIPPDAPRARDVLSRPNS
jgi:uncharacterized protein (DUF1501 family)